jgi:hypothetical protein
MSRLSATAAWLALFFSLAGTGLAASHYLITSTSQIKPSVRRGLRGMRGPEGAAGPIGATGAPGAPGKEANISSLESRLNELCFAIGLARIGDGVLGPTAGKGAEEVQEHLESVLATIETTGC